MILYEYVDRRGKGAISDWSLQPSEQALLDLHMRQLKRVTDPNHLPGLFFGARKRAPHIIKIKIGGKIRLRPMVCRGPMDSNREVTILFPAVERNGKLVPLDAPEIAERRRQEILADPRRRRRYDPPE